MVSEQDIQKAVKEAGLENFVVVGFKKLQRARGFLKSSKAARARIRRRKLEIVKREQSRRKAEEEQKKRIQQAREKVKVSKGKAKQLAAAELNKLKQEERATRTTNRIPVAERITPRGVARTFISKQRQQSRGEIRVAEKQAIAEIEAANIPQSEKEALKEEVSKEFSAQAETINPLRRETKEFDTGKGKKFETKRADLTINFASVRPKEFEQTITVDDSGRLAAKGEGITFRTRPPETQTIIEFLPETQRGQAFGNFSTGETFIVGQEEKRGELSKVVPIVPEFDKFITASFESAELAKFTGRRSDPKTFEKLQLAKQNLAETRAEKDLIVETAFQTGEFPLTQQLRLEGLKFKETLQGLEVAGGTAKIAAKERLTPQNIATTGLVGAAFGVGEQVLVKTLGSSTGGKIIIGGSLLLGGAVALSEKERIKQLESLGLSSEEAFGTVAGGLAVDLPVFIGGAAFGRRLPLQRATPSGFKEGFQAFIDKSQAQFALRGAREDIKLVTSDVPFKTDKAARVTLRSKEESQAEALERFILSSGDLNLRKVDINTPDFFGVRTSGATSRKNIQQVLLSNELFKGGRVIESEIGKTAEGEPIFSPVIELPARTARRTQIIEELLSQRRNRLKKEQEALIQEELSKTDIFPRPEITEASKAKGQTFFGKSSIAVDESGKTFIDLSKGDSAALKQGVTGINIKNINNEIQALAEISPKTPVTFKFGEIGFNQELAAASRLKGQTKIKTEPVRDLPSDVDLIALELQRLGFKGGKQPEPIVFGEKGKGFIISNEAGTITVKGKPQQPELIPEIDFNIPKKPSKTFSSTGESSTINVAALRESELFSKQTRQAQVPTLDLSQPPLEPPETFRRIINEPIATSKVDVLTTPRVLDKIRISPIIEKTKSGVLNIEKTSLIPQAQLEKFIISQDVKQPTLTDFGVRFKQEQVLIPDVKIDTDFRRRTRTSSDIQNIFITETTTPTPPPPIPPPPKLIIVPPPNVPPPTGILTPSPAIGGIFEGFKGFKRPAASQKKAFRPTFLAVITGTKGKATRRGVKSGLGIRPVPLKATKFFRGFF